VDKPESNNIGWVADGRPKRATDSRGSGRYGLTPLVALKTVVERRSKYGTKEVPSKLSQVDQTGRRENREKR